MAAELIAVIGGVDNDGVGEVAGGVEDLAEESVRLFQEVEVVASVAEPVIGVEIGGDFALVLGVGITRVQGGRKFTLDAVYRMASDGTRSEAVGSAFDADGIDVTLGVRF